MVLAHAVEFDAGIAADGCIDETGDLTDGARSEGCQLINAAAVDGELRHLLVADEVAALSGIGLNLDGIGFDRDGFLRRTHLHLEVDADAVTNRQDDVPSDLGDEGFRMDEAVPLDIADDRALDAAIKPGRRLALYAPDDETAAEDGGAA